MMCPILKLKKLKHYYQMALHGKDSVALPNVEITLAFDNIDRLDDTLRWKSTSHKANDLVVQPRSLDPKPLDNMRSTYISVHKKIEVPYPDYCRMNSEWTNHSTGT